jgi:hypothetical protein
MDRTGVTRVFRATPTCEELGISPLGEKGDSTPAFVGKRIYIRGKKYLYCMEET